MKVFVYWNIRRGLWSIKDIEPGSTAYGKVIDRSPTVLLRDVQGKVSEAGRQRVLRERRKNVHAGIVGTLYDYRQANDIAKACWGVGDRITYNPYKYERFVHTVDESPFEGSDYALLTADRAVYVA